MSTSTVAYVVRPAGFWGPFPAGDVPGILTEEPGFILVTGQDDETTHRAAMLAARHPGGAWDHA